MEKTNLQGRDEGRSLAQVRQERKVTVQSNLQGRCEGQIGDENLNHPPRTHILRDVLIHQFC